VRVYSDCTTAIQCHERARPETGTACSGLVYKVCQQNGMGRREHHTVFFFERK